VWEVLKPFDAGDRASVARGPVDDVPLGQLEVCGGVRARVVAGERLDLLTAAMHLADFGGSPSAVGVVAMCLFVGSGLWRQPVGSCAMASAGGLLREVTEVPDCGPLFIAAFWSRETCVLGSRVRSLLRLIAALVGEQMPDRGCPVGDDGKAVRPSCAPSFVRKGFAVSLRSEFRAYGARGQSALSPDRLGTAIVLRPTHRPRRGSLRCPSVWKRCRATRLQALARAAQPPASERTLAFHVRPPSVVRYLTRLV
jgi:hypothetical protein